MALETINTAVFIPDLIQISQPEITVQPLTPDNETGLDGITVPLVITDILPEAERWMENNPGLTARKKYYETVNLQTEEALKNGAEKISVPLNEAFDFLYQTQADTIQPEIAREIIRGISEFILESGGTILEEHGGATRRLATFPSKYYREHPTDEIIRTYFRWADCPVRQIPADGSLLPDEEKLADRIVERLAAHSFNQDLYTDVPLNQFKLLKEKTVTQILMLLVYRGIDNVQIFESDDPNTGIEIRIPYKEGLWEKPWMRGFKQIEGKSNFESEDKIFQFAPTEKASHFVIKIHQFTPGENKNWQLVRFAWGIAGANGFIDASEICLNTIPTAENGLLPLDKRHGYVDTRQKEMTSGIDLTDGTITIPRPDIYMDHDTRIDPKILKNKTLGQLMTLFSRPFRYPQMIDVFNRILDEKGRKQFPYSQYETTISDMKLVTREMAERIAAGERLSEGEEVEFFADLILAFHNSSHPSAGALRQTAIKEGKSVIMPLVKTLLNMRLSEPRGSIGADGRTLVWRRSGDITWDSGIEDLLNSLKWDVVDRKNDWASHWEFFQEMTALEADRKDFASPEEKTAWINKKLLWESRHLLEIITPVFMPPLKASPLARLLWLLKLY